MKKTKSIFLIILLAIILCIYLISFNIFGNKEKTKVNQNESNWISEQPRLEDNFYQHVNYEYLNKNYLEDDKITDYATNQTEKIEEEKKIIIDELLTDKSAIGTKIRNFYNSFTNSTEEKSISELKKYIDKINNSQNISKFVNNAIDINYQLSTDILFSPDILFDPEGESEKYFGLNLITYDWDNTSGFYMLEDYEYAVRMYKKYNIQILKKYGYSSNKAIEISERVQEMFKEISRFSELDQNKLFEKGFKTYKINDLQAQLNNIPLKTLIGYYSEFCGKNDEILVVDINQLLMIDNYLKEENLETLKNYAELKILTTYSNYISENYSKIYTDYICESKNYLDIKESTIEEIGYQHIYNFFKDTITEKFAEKHFTSEQKDFYTNLIKEEIDAYKIRIKNEEWLSEETKQKALKKIENMTYTVGVPEKYVKVENRYKIDEGNSYMSNVINMKQNLKKEEMKQYMQDNIFYNMEEADQLTFNAFYMPNNNSINLLLGYIYSLTESLNLGKENLEENYYKILGSVGVTVGHELSHALDTLGAKYDENGNFINWWTQEDEYNFNTLISKVVKYYEKYDQFGDTTIGENIADLGGMAIVNQIAESKNATEENYKELFEAYALNWASQLTSIAKEWQLKNDEHSPEKNRVNVVLSTMEKFHEVYNIRETDKMYVRPEERVKVW